MDLGFNMNILDIGSGFTGSEFQLRQASFAIDHWDVAVHTGPAATL